MRLNREFIALLVLLLIFIGGGLLLTGRNEGKSRLVGKEAYPDPSIYNDRASGSRGCFEWVAKLGYRPLAWRQNWSALGSSRASVLLVIAPRSFSDFSALTGTPGEDAQNSAALGPSDAAALLSWLRAGHTAILLSSRLAGGHIAGESGGTDTFADALDLIAETAMTGRRTEFSPLQPTRATRGVLSVHSDAYARLRRKSADALALFGDSAGPFALSVPVGQGHLIAIADSEFASNANLPRSENAVFLANLLGQAAEPGAVVLFDEYHHGDIDLGSEASLWAALGHPLQLVLIQIAVAFLVLAAALAVRFGSPIPLGQGISRTSTEYVTSLAMLYRRAQASTAALETLYRQFLRDLALRLALAPDVSLERLAEVAARRGGIDRSALRRLLATCEQRLDDGKVTEPELLDLARRMERIRKDIGIA